jgi:photosystem II stability/assembly factor-like uncharacterized protein
VLPSGKVEHTTNGGAQWNQVAIDSSFLLISGTAPSASVCWLVGRAGVVLRSTDGATFERVAFPEATDLKSISATDARTAIILTADGRTFTTADGGLTWRRDDGWGAGL